MEEVIGPLKESPLISRYARCLSWPNDSGIFPISLLEYKDKTSNFGELKMLGGISPLRELPLRSRFMKLVVRLENQLGIS